MSAFKLWRTQSHQSSTATGATDTPQQGLQVLINNTVANGSRAIQGRNLHLLKMSEMKSTTHGHQDHQCTNMALAILAAKSLMVFAFSSLTLIALSRAPQTLQGPRIARHLRHIEQPRLMCPATHNFSRPDRSAEGKLRRRKRPRTSQHHAICPDSTTMTWTRHLEELYAIEASSTGSMNRETGANLNARHLD